MRAPHRASQAIAITGDGEGYPTTQDLTRIERFPSGEPAWRILMAKLRPIWRYGSDGYWAEERAVNTFGEPVMRYHCSTAGWSGNEAIVGALKRNQLFWLCCWAASRRGGHHIFEIAEPQTHHKISRGGAVAKEKANGKNSHRKS